MTATEAEEGTVHPQRSATPKLNKALSQLQGELPRITKTKTGKVEGQNKDGKYFSYEYSYADLGDVVADVGPLLAKYGLAFHCGPTRDPADRREMILAWSLLHESGEEKTGEWPLGPAAQKPQSLGSAITYGRRYCFTAATNIVLEDDDDGRRAQQDHGTRQSAGDAFESAAPRQDNWPRGTVTQHDSDSSTPEDRHRWADGAIQAAASLKTEAEGQTLWREANAARRDGRATRDEADHVQNLITARIADRRREVSAMLLAHLPEDDPWRLKAEELSDDQGAQSALEELGRLKAAGTLDEARVQQVARAIIARFPKAAVRAGNGDG